MKQLLTFLMLLTTCGAFAQTLSPTVVASAGRYGSSTTGSLSYTVGEPVTTTLTTGSNILTQGFQQPDDKDVSVTHLQLPGLQVKLYPNPASETVNLWIKCETNACNNLHVSIHDLLGRELNVPAEVANNGNEMLYAFNVKALAASMYFIHLQNDKQSFSQIIKFNKTSL